MKEFFKMMAASMLGFFLVYIVVFFIGMIIFFSVISLSKKDVTVVAKNTVLHLKLDEAIEDRGSDNPFDNINFSSFKSKDAPGLDAILRSLKNAKDDENIKGIYLDLTAIPSGMATVEEIRNALIDFKKSGKFIMSYSETYTQQAFYLASVSDKIYLNPEGSLDFRGLNAQVMFLKGTMDKLDVEPQIIRHGKFKSAVEPLIYDKMSDASKEQTLSYITSIWKHMLKGISESRKISITDLNLIADSFKVQTADDALKYKMIDKIAYVDEVYDDLRTKLSLGKTDKISFLSLSKYSNAPNKSKKKKSTSKDKIAVVYATGDIVSGEGDNNTIGSVTISEAIRTARMDENVKAVVLRVNSPGGSALASEIIWREVVLTKKVKPIVVSMGNLAASGGYYISCAADKIVCSPNTITGSIGVFGIIPNMLNFFKNKLGITFDNVKTNNYADFMSTTRSLRADETNLIQLEIERIYKTFIKHVAEGRKMTISQIDSIGQGRVWSGADAKRLGLVDEFGGLDKAIEIAAKLAKIEDYKTTSLPKQTDPFTKIIEEMMGTKSQTMIEKELGENYIYFQHMKSMMNMKGVQARMPYDIQVY